MRFDRVPEVEAVDERRPDAGAYSTARAGVIGLTEALAKEVATKGILVHAGAPPSSRPSSSSR